MWGDDARDDRGGECAPQQREGEMGDRLLDDEEDAGDWGEEGGGDASPGPNRHELAHQPRIIALYARGRDMRLGAGCMVHGYMVQGAGPYGDVPSQRGLRRDEGQ